MNEWGNEWGNKGIQRIGYISINMKKKVINFIYLLINLVNWYICNYLLFSIQLKWCWISKSKIDGVIDLMFVKSSKEKRREEKRIRSSKSKNLVDEALREKSVEEREEYWRETREETRQEEQWKLLFNKEITKRKI